MAQLRRNITDGEYPCFDDAERRLCAFLLENGVTTDLLYVSPRDVAVSRGRLFIRVPEPSMARVRATADYLAAVANQRGVLLSALCRLGARACVYVYGPVDDDEAERLMYPNGLKLSVPVALPVACEAGLAGWWYLKWRDATSMGGAPQELLK